MSTSSGLGLGYAADGATVLNERNDVNANDFSAGKLFAYDGFGLFVVGVAIHRYQYHAVRRVIIGVDPVGQRSHSPTDLASNLMNTALGDG